MDWVLDPSIWTGLLTLTALEIVLGIDNIVFLSILAARLPLEQQANARRVGLMLAMLMRIGLLLSLKWAMGLTSPIFVLPMLTGEAGEVTGRDLILFLGGLFLIAKSTHEIHERVESHAPGARAARPAASFASVIVQIVLVDIVFSLDSVITAIGMVEQIGVMVAAVVIAVAMMMVFAGPVSAFVEKHPTVKMLALAFLVLIGVNLLADSLGQHIPKGYTYFAMAFSVGVEMLNLRLRGGSSGPAHAGDAPAGG